MKKFIFLAMILIFSQSIIFSQDIKPKKIYVNITVTGSTTKILSTFYVFNTIEEGDKICRELFNFNNIEYVILNENFTPVAWIEPSSEFLKYEYAVMKNGYEFWVFKNQGDGKLWGKGYFSYKVGEKSE